MRLGVCSWAFDGIVKGTRPAADLVDAAMAAGFDCIEGAFGLRGDLSPGSQPGAVPANAIRSLATLQLHRYSLMDADAGRRNKAREIVEEMIRTAARWGIPSISFGPGRRSAGEDLSALAACLDSLVESAARCGVEVGVENVPGHVLDSRQEMAALLKLVRPPLSLCLDLGNALVDPPLDAWVEAFGERISKIHLSDGALAEGRFVPRLPTEGAVRWEQAGAALRGAGWRGPVFVEAVNEAGTPEGAFLGHLREVSDRAVERMGLS